MPERKTAAPVILDVEGLTVEYRTPGETVRALNGVNFSIRKGQTLGLVGETGAGKTTTGLSILQLVPSPPGVLVSGRIVFDGLDLTKLSDKEMQSIRGSRISMIFQDPMTSLNPVMSVERQIAEVISFHEKTDTHAAVEKARFMLERVGIAPERGSEFPHQFSGGMKQRVVIAIALACTPQLLIADEPTTALDVTIQAQVLELMKDLRARNDTSMLMITHDLGIVADICDAVAVIYGGRVVEYGTLEDIFENCRHPYTEGLFNSLPNLKNRSEMLKPIRGDMPDPSRLPKGCVFRPRCDYALEICKTEKPGPVYRTEEHFAACHLYDENTISERLLLSHGR
ncbi:MAG: ABC transporter ATP-binding protein [Synergistaceae bacterium]|nr:ABC transporter ATP-binding protein [Synergistaceae bacterium]